MKTWLAALACVAFLSGAGLESTEVPSGPEIVETPGSLVVIEQATLGLDEQATSVVTLRVRATEPLSGFTARVMVYEQHAKKPRGFTSRFLGPVGLETRTFKVPIEGFFISDTDRIKIVVGPAKTAEKEQFCGSGFCVEERKNCVQMCGAGCVARFTCKAGNLCESDCFCKTTPGC